MSQETIVVQIANGPHGAWRDYSRCTPEQAESFLAANGTERFRAVDWLTKTPVVFATWRVIGEADTYTMPVAANLDVTEAARKRSEQFLERPVKASEILLHGEAPYGWDVVKGGGEAR